MQHTSVKKLFKEQVGQYSHKDQYKHSPLAILILEWLKGKKRNKKIQICEFGGGAGQLLGVIAKSYPGYSYTNVEIISDYKQFLVSHKIKFVVDSVLHSNFRSQSFDILIMRDVLHHLVGKNYKESRHNQISALGELKRLLKPGGAIFIEELTNTSGFATRLIYYLTRLNSRVGVQIPSLSLSSNIIVAFLTPTKLLNYCRQMFGEKNMKTQILDIRMKWYIRIVHLFGRLEKVAVVVNL